MRNAPSPFIKEFEIKPYKEGILSGLTFAVKDLIDIKGLVTGCGNPTWAKRHPKAAAHAVCVEQLLSAGATCVGKTITDELAFGLLGENHFYGTPLNPTAPDRVPGGSSSGSASAVAQGLVDFALGTDTGGSVRVPASFCQIYGFRPTHGRISMAGVNPFAPTLDTVGAFARDLDVLEKVIEVLVGEAEGPVEYYELISLDEIELPPLDRLISYWTIQCAEIWSSLGSWIEDEHPEFGPRPKSSFEMASESDRTNLAEAFFHRERFARALNKMLEGDRYFHFPTTPTPPPIIGEVELDRQSSDFFHKLLTQTSLSGLGKVPQISIPTGEIGLSIVGAQNSDMRLLSVAREQAHTT